MIDICAICQQTCEYIDCPTGGWWAHLKHPADGHDADPWGHTTRRSTPDIDWEHLVGPYLKET